MKIVCNREKFLSGFLIVSGLVPTRSPKDILSNIKLEAIDGKLVLMATDQEAGIRLEIPDVEIQTPGKALLNVQRIGNILRYPHLRDHRQLPGYPWGKLRVPSPIGKPG